MGRLLIRDAQLTDLRLAGQHMRLSPATPAAQPAVPSLVGGRLTAGSYHCFIAGQFNAKFDCGLIRVSPDGNYLSHENVRGRSSYNVGTGAVTWNAGLGGAFKAPLGSVYHAADDSIQVTYQLDTANTQSRTCWRGR